MSKIRSHWFATALNSLTTHRPRVGAGQRWAWANGCLAWWIAAMMCFGAEAADAPSAAAGGEAGQTFEIRHFEVRGNTAFSAEELDRVLGAWAGRTIRVEQLREIAGRLREAYRERGYWGASVTVPRQWMAGGRVVFVVREGLSPEARVGLGRMGEAVNSGTNPVPAAVVFEVRRYEVEGNTVLGAEEVERAFEGASGREVTFGVVQQALGRLQMAYRERGYATVSVALPPQRLTNGVVRVLVTEGKLAEVQVAGNRHFSSNNVMRALPSLRTQVLLNSHVFQRELDAANQNRDRQIYPTIGPGAEPGTSALTLRVKDRLPVHGRLELNNQATPGTPEWRVNASAQYNNVWQREHQAGLSYGFSPEAFKSDGLVSDLILNRPLVANFGGYYRFPFGGPEAVEQRVASSDRFGFDESTRQFRLPPAGGRPDVSVFASASSSDTGVQLGPAKVVSQTPLLTIVSQDSGQNLTVNEAIGARMNAPWVLTDSRRWSFSGGLDWKRFYLRSMNTNNFRITTVVTNAQGSQTIESVVSSPQPTRTVEVQYLPLVAGADYSQVDRWGTLNAGVTVGGNFTGDDSDFARAAYTTNAAMQSGRATFSVTRDQRLFRDWSLLVRASGQAATGALIANEQFSIGGFNSVRGYLEGDSFGDLGWFSSAELRTPFLQVSAPVGAKSAPVWLRASVFMDYGQGYLLENAAGRDEQFALWGAGFGVSANVNNVFDVRLTVGWPLSDSQLRRAGDTRAYLTVGGQF